MPHFYVKPKDIVGGQFRISGEEAHHIIRVLRYKKGQEINLFDGSGQIYMGKIEEILKDELKGTIINKKEGKIPKIRINLYQSIPKGERFDWLIEKSAELGVKRVIPIYTERSVVRNISVSKIGRWQRISLGACEQSNRADIMDVSAPLDLTEALKGLPLNSTSIIPWESENIKTFEDIINANKLPEEVNIFIGPEGGFSNREIEIAVSKNVIPVTLGPRILRVETAGLLSVVLVMNLAGEYNGSR
ncbi:MAG: RsmE family RNA methyltransferase [Elusimicrobia bacterium]|nr:RsmE family RNA methyltransferase [Elusimicrobiota bacterium]